MKGRFDGPKLIVKAEQLGLFGGAPRAPQGFTPIPGSKRGGYHKRQGAGYVYWYPDTGVVSAPHSSEHPEVHARHAVAEAEALRAEGLSRPTEPESAPTGPSRIKIVRVNPETGEEEELRPGAPKPKPVEPSKPLPEPPVEPPAPAPVEEPVAAPEEPKVPEAKLKAPRKPREKPKQEPLLTVPAGPEEEGKFETTGYVFGSRAELWSLRNAGELEKDPAVAYKLVHKEAVMGGKIEAGSFASEAFAGTRPAAAYFKFRLLQAIQSRPDDSPDARERFARQIATVQNSLAELRTTEDIDEWVKEVKDQLNGVAPKETISEEELKARGWDVLVSDRPTVDWRASDVEQKEQRAALQIWSDLRKQAEDGMKERYGEVCDIRAVGDNYVIMGEMSSEIYKAAVQDWDALGPRFLAIVGKKISYPARKKWSSLAVLTDHVVKRYRVSLGMLDDEKIVERATADAKKKWNEWRIDSAYDSELRSKVRHEVHRIQGLDPGAGGELDEQAQRSLAEAWKWLMPESMRTQTMRTEKEEGGDKYHTILAQERLGETTRKGPPVPGGAGSEELKADLGLREVEYGKWVSGKGAEAVEAGRERQWHTQAAHAALHDLAHVMGITPQEVGQKGRLTVAFGSRGSGRAHATYYPAVKAINITKLNGKGSLAHEWGHFMDHMVLHISEPGRGADISLADLVAQGKGADLKVPPDVLHAMTGVMDAIMHEPMNEAEAMRASREHIEELRTAYYQETDREKKEQHRLELNAAVNTHNRAVRGKGSFKRPTVFHKAAQEMGDYWCRPHEMFARCFESWVTDKLEAEGRENTYLVKGTRFPIPGYFPQGDLRERIGKAMDALAAALRADQHFQKAMPWSTWFRAVVHGPELRVPQGA